LPVSKNNIFYFCLQAKKVDSLQINRINQSNVYPELPVAPLGGTGLLSFPKLIRVPFFNSKSANKVAEIAAIPAAKRFNLFKLLQITKNSLRRKL